MTSSVLACRPLDLRPLLACEALEYNLRVRVDAQVRNRTRIWRQGGAVGPRNDATNASR